MIEKGLTIITNTSLGFAMTIFAVIGGAICFACFLKKSDHNAARWLAAICGVYSAMALCQAGFFLSSNIKLVLFLYEIELILYFISYVVIFLFVYKVAKHRMFSWKPIAGLLALPVVGLLLILTKVGSGFMWKNMRLEAFAEPRMVIFEAGIWYWALVAISIATIVISLILSIQYFIITPKNYKTSAAIIGIGVASHFMGIATQIIPDYYFPAEISFLVGLTILSLFYASIFHMKDLDIMFNARDVIVENADYAILMLDTNETIVEFNQNADTIGSRAGLETIRGISYNQYINTILVHFEARLFPEDPSIFTISESDESKDAHYRISKREIFSQKGKLIGHYVSIKDITPIMSLVHKLEASAYYDQMTGLRNRNSYQEKLQELDNSANLPLAIVMCDVNRLKHINDTFGHQKGDLLLQEIGRILQEASPKKAILARIGGDEFAILMPKTSKKNVIDMINAIYEGCEDMGDPDLVGAGVAIGYKIRESMDEDMSSCIKEADALMYENKRKTRQNCNND